MEAYLRTYFGVCVDGKLPEAQNDKNECKKTSMYMSDEMKRFDVHQIVNGNASHSNTHTQGTCPLGFCVQKTGPA